MPDEEIPEFLPGEGYEPARPPVPESPPAATPGRLPTAIITAPMIHDPDDQTGARCGDPGPNVKAEGKMVNLPCVRRRGHQERGEADHRCFSGQDPLTRVWYQWT